MRRLIIEFAISDVTTILNEPSLEKIDSMEVLSFLESKPDEVALICRVRLKDPEATVESIFNPKFIEVQVLERNKGTSTCFFRQKRPPRESKLDPIGSGGYLSIPYEINDGHLKASFLGNAREIKGILQGLEKSGVPYKLVSITDARFLPDSPLGRLTPKQRKVILSAFHMGYYDVPRKVSSEELADRLNIREPTLVMHRRKAERRLLAAIVEGS
jgi:DNA-binding CsgD family transcriptional regulator